MKTSAAATPWAWLYYVSFIIAVFVVINLFIAVVINNLEKARREDAETAGVSIDELARELRNVAEQVGELANGLRRLAEVRKAQEASPDARDEAGPKAG